MKFKEKNRTINVPLGQWGGFMVNRNAGCRPCVLLKFQKKIVDYGKE
tara:strand:- start:6666 stop:6806 length:141 start_codon:yes stop_codon:yes gene_type:complete